MKRLIIETIPRSGVTGIVIRGEGRHFSSGADLEDLFEMLREEEVPEGCGSAGSSLLVEHLDSFRYFQRCEVPVVAAIRGVCLGSALELALFCHRRVCGRGSVLGLPESTFGLIPGCGGVSMLTSLAGCGRSMELILSGETFSAEDAFRWNIVDLVCGKDDVLREAEGCIERINQRSLTIIDGE